MHKQIVILCRGRRGNPSRKPALNEAEGELRLLFGCIVTIQPRRISIFQGISEAQASGVIRWAFTWITPS